MILLNAAKAFIFALLMMTATDKHGPLKCPPTLSIPLFYVATHHGVDPLAAGALVAAEHRGRKFDPREVGRFGAVGGEAGELSVWHGFAKLATYRCNPSVRAATDSSLARRYDGMPGDCLFIGADQAVEYKVERAPDLIRLKRGCDDPENRDCIARRRVGALLEDDPKRLDLFMRRVNIEAGIIAWKYAQEETDREWGRRYGIDWRASIRCSNAAWRNDRRTKRQRASYARCQRGVRKVLAWESILRGRRVRLAGAARSHSRSRSPRSRDGQATR